MKFKFSALVLAALVSTIGGLTGCDFVMDQISQQPKPETTGKGKGKSQKDTQSVSSTPKLDQTEGEQDREPTIEEVLATFSEIGKRVNVTKVETPTEKTRQEEILEVLRGICYRSQTKEMVKALDTEVKTGSRDQITLNFTNAATALTFCPGAKYYSVKLTPQETFAVEWNSQKVVDTTEPTGPRWDLSKLQQSDEPKVSGNPNEGSSEKPETPETQTPKESSLGEKPQTEVEKPKGDSAFQGSMNNASPDLFYAAYTKLAQDNGYEPLFDEQQAFSQAIVVCESTKAKTLANSVHGFKQTLGNKSSQNQIIVGFIGLAIPTFCPNQKQAAIAQLKGVFEDKVDGLY
jgi:hypothetical protein